MSEPVLVALIGGGCGALVAVIQIVGIRLNSRQHGDSMRIVAEVRDDLRDVKGDMRDAKNDLRDVKKRVSALERIDVRRVDGDTVLADREAQT